MSQNHPQTFIPIDDGELEMEELEGLVNIRSSGPGQPRRSSFGGIGTKRPPSPRPRLRAALAAANTFLSQGRNRSRLALLIGIVASIAFWTMVRVDDSVVQDASSAGVAGGLVDVEGKVEVGVSSTADSLDGDAHVVQGFEGGGDFSGGKGEESGGSDVAETENDASGTAMEEESEKNQQEQTDNKHNDVAPVDEEVNPSRDEYSNLNDAEEGKTLDSANEPEQTGTATEDGASNPDSNGDEAKGGEEDVDASATDADGAQEQDGQEQTGDQPIEEGDAETGTVPLEKEGEAVAGEGDGEGEEETPDNLDTGTGNEEPQTPKVEAKDWGHWKFYDGDEENRPPGDYCGAFPNRDITAEDFPENAWQTDAVYVNHFLDEAQNLINRAREAIYSEYGHSLPLSPEESVKRSQMFHIDFVDLEAGESPNSKEVKEKGGWTTKSSFDGLSRRLLHAMMTNDNFTVVLGGHSAAAGHGNHFKQSYTMQFHEIMEPIFARLGVKLVTRNLAQGGLGTMQAALGSRDLYGDEVDVLIWDSHMTERGADEFDLFCRQAILGGNRPPFLLAPIGSETNVLTTLHKSAGADIGMFGSGKAGIPLTVDEVQVESLPWAARYLVCDQQSQQLCNDGGNKYRTKCWVERPDVTPPTEQVKHAGSQVKWHPGFRTHKLTGRVLSFWILDALETALEQWMEVTIIEGDPLPDEYWHITEHYDTIRRGVRDMNETFCEQKPGIPKRVCHIPLHARAEYTPRANADSTSIRSILKPAPDGYAPSITKTLLYEGEDVPNPALEVPDGEIDVRSIISARRRLLTRRLKSSRNGFYLEANDRVSATRKKTTAKRYRYADRIRRLDGIVPGRGWSIQEQMAGSCDGTMSAICGRHDDSSCLLGGHHDHRGTLVGDPLSGWIVMELKDVRKGIIMIKHDWTKSNNQQTIGWTEENDGKRNLAPTPPKPEVIFDYALNGEITTLNSTQVWERSTHPQRVVRLLTLLDDDAFVKDGESMDVEVGIRLRGCNGKERECVFAFSHIYWA